MGTLWDAAEDARSIDLNAFDPGSISQTIDTVAGQTYNVTFAMSGNPDANVRGPKTMNVTAAQRVAGFTYDTAENTTADMKYKDQTFSFAATGPPDDADLHEHHRSGDRSRSAAGPVIDDVMVTAAPNVVKTKVWHTWTGGPVDLGSGSSDAGWHPTSGDPQSKVHKSENHKVACPYYVPNGNKGGGAWFLWTDRLIHRINSSPSRFGGAGGCGVIVPWSDRPHHSNPRPQ